MKKTRLFLLFTLTILSILLCLSLSACGDTGDSSNKTDPVDEDLVWIEEEDGIYITGYKGTKKTLEIPASIEGVRYIIIRSATPS